MQTKDNRIESKQLGPNVQYVWFVQTDKFADALANADGRTDDSERMSLKCILDKNGNEQFEYDEMKKGLMEFSRLLDGKGSYSSEIIPQDMYEKYKELCRAECIKEGRSGDFEKYFDLVYREMRISIFEEMCKSIDEDSYSGPKTSPLNCPKA